MSDENIETLARRDCVPCRGGIPALRGEPLLTLHRALAHGWALIDEHHLEKEFHFPDFASALVFTNRVGAIAEEQNHHPDVLLRWGSVTLSLWTHKIDGLTESDFVLAAKIEEAYRPHAVP